MHFVKMTMMCCQQHQPLPNDGLLSGLGFQIGGGEKFMILRELRNINFQHLYLTLNNVCLLRGFHPIRQFFTHMETSLLPVKG